MIRFFVEYRIAGFPQLFRTQGFETIEIANQHRDDIAGYEGVHSLTVTLEEVPQS